MSDDVRGNLGLIYARLRGVGRYHPFSADTFADWSVEAGDTVTISRGSESYTSPLTSTKIVWRGTPMVQMNSTGSDEREPVSVMSREKYGRGSGMRNQQDLYWALYSEDGYFNSYLSMTASRLRIAFTDALNSLHSYLEMTASHLRIEFTNEINSLRGELEMTASHLRTEFTDGLNSLRGEFEMTASHLRTEFTNEINSLRGEFEMTASHLRTDFLDEVNSLRSVFEVTASHLRTEFKDEVNSLRSVFEVTASHLQTVFYDEINSMRGVFETTASHLRTEYTQIAYGLRGEFELTASHMRSEYTSEFYGLRGDLEMTASHLRTEFSDDVNSLRGTLEMTASHLRTEFTDDMNSLRGIVEATASHLRTEFTDEVNSLRGTIEATASHLRTEFADDVNSLRGTIEATASHLRTEFTDDVNSLRGVIDSTASHLRTEFTDDVNSLRGTIEATASHLRTEFTDEVNSVRSEFVITAQSLRTEFTDEVNGVRGELTITAQSLRTEFTDDVNSVRSEFVITAQSLRTEFTDDVNSLRGEFAITAQSLRSEFVDDVNSVRGELVQTASYLQSAFTDDVNSVRSELVQTASSLQSTIESTASSLSSSIQQQANRISLVVEGTGSNAKIKAAQIVESINGQTGESQVLISASKVLLDGTTKINDVMTITDNRVWISKDMRVSGDIMAESLTLRTGSDSQQLTEAIISSMIKTASVSGNTLTLTRFNNTEINFNKAVSLSGGWNGGVYGVTATAGTISGQAPRTTLFDLGLGTASKGTGSTVTATYDIGYASVVQGQQVRGGSTGKTGTLSLDVSSLLQARTGELRITENDTYTPGDNYIGFSSVVVDVQAPSVTPVISHEWSNAGQLTVTTSPTAQENFVRRLTQGTTSWSSNTASVPIVAKYGSQDQYSEDTNLTVTVNATGRYRAGSVNVELPDFSSSSWSTLPNANITVSENTASISTTGRVDLNGDSANITRTLPIKTTQGDWNTTTNKKYVYVHYSSTADTNRIARVEVDASGLVSDATTTGKNAVTLDDPDWTYDPDYTTGSTNTVTVTTIGRPTEIVKSIPVTLVQSAWDGNNKTVDIQTTNGAIVARIDVNGANRYDAGGATAKVNQSSQTLGYGGSVTVTAQYVNAEGTTVNTSSSCTITAPADNKQTGWDLAVGKVSLPTSSTLSSMSVVTPGSTYDTSGPTTYTVSADNDYAYITQGNTVVARATNNAYSNGWLNARYQCDAPTSGSDSYVRVYICSDTVGGTRNSIDYTINVTNTQAKIMWGNSQVAVVNHSAYSNGWSSAYDKVSIPGSNTSTKYATFGAPKASSGSSSYALSMGDYGNDDTDLFMSVDGATAITIARYNHGKYTAGYNAALGNVNYATLDFNAQGIPNCYGLWHNFKVYDGPGGNNIKNVYANSSGTTGIYLPLHENYPITANDTYFPESGFVGFKSIIVNVPQSTGYDLSWIGQGFVEYTSSLPSGTQHQLNNLKTQIVNNRSRRGYIYFRIKINNDYHVYYFADNGDGWTT